MTGRCFPKGVSDAQRTQLEKSQCIGRHLQGVGGFAGAPLQVNAHTRSKLCPRLSAQRDILVVFFSSPFAHSIPTVQLSLFRQIV